MGWSVWAIDEPIRKRWEGTTRQRYTSDQIDRTTWGKQKACWVRGPALSTKTDYTDNKTANNANYHRHSTGLHPGTRNLRACKQVLSLWDMNGVKLNLYLRKQHLNVLNITLYPGKTRDPAFSFCKHSKDTSWWVHRNICMIRREIVKIFEPLKSCITQQNIFQN